MRIKKLEDIMESLGLEASLVAYEWNVFYFTRVPRPGGSYLLLVKGWTPKLLVPALDFWRVSSFVKNEEIEVLPYSTYEIPGIEAKPITQNLASWIEGQLKSAEVRRIGIDLSHVTSLAIKVKEKVSGIAQVTDVSGEISKLRMVKDDEEISLMREAVRITEGALRKTLLDLKPGLREYEIAAMLEGSMRFMGADGYAFETIVASGPNGAFPHALPTSKEVMEGEEIVIDMGARFGGYCADMTRTVVLGKGDKEIRNNIEALNEAVNEATDAVAPGISVSEIDSIARKVLARHGLDKYFIHSLGHGVGVEVHEPPRVAQGVNTVLEPGNVITIEPGVYINGKYGARIENMVLVTKSGHDVLNSLPNLV